MRRAIPGILGCALIVVAIPALIYLGLITRRPVPHPASYWTVDDRTIGVLITSGGGIVCGVASVDETSTEVRLRTECAEPWLSLGSTADLKLTVVTVALGTSLGQRTVIDGLGQPAVRCESEATCP